MTHGSNRTRGALLALATAGAIGLLGAAPAHATGFITASNTNCKVWSDDEGTSGAVWTSTWVGPCKNGIAEGPGVQEWFKDGVFNARFEGPMSQGKRSGTGVYTWASGDRYEGSFGADGRTGKAKYWWPNGDYYEGDFIAGKRTGKGVYVWPNGKRYEGDFVNSQITGEGTQIEPNGNIYKGQWLDNQFQGPGVITFAQDGSQRAGTFVNSKIWDGADTNADGSLIATYSNGVRTRANTSSSSDGPGVFSFVAGLLGAAAQGVASGGGRNAVQMQAVATALQATSGSGSSSTMPAAQPAPMPVAASGNNYGTASGGATGSNANAGRKTVPPLTGCVEQVRIPRGGKGWGGWWDWETGIKNTCSYAIIVAWCVTGDNSADDAARCEKQYSGFYGLQPGEQSSMHTDRFGTLQTLICKDPARPLNITWSGTRFTGQCILVPGMS